MKAKAFLLLLLLLLLFINYLFIENLKNLPYANYYLLLLAINIDLLALTVITAVILRKLIKVYLGKRKNVLRRKLANILFLYLFVPILLLNLFSIVVVIQSTKEYLSSKTRALSSTSEKVYRELYKLELSKIQTFRTIAQTLIEAGLEEKLSSLEGVVSVIPVGECSFEVSEMELSYRICVNSGRGNYVVEISKDIELIRSVSSFGEMALDLRAFVKTRDIITGVFVFFIVFITLLTFLATVWLAMLIARHISEPIERLSDKALLISSGDLNVEVDVEKTGDEIERLSKAFKTMKDNLQRIYEELKSEKELLQKLVEALPVGVAFLKKNGGAIVNESFKKLTETENPHEGLKRAKQNNNLKIEEVKLSEGKIYIIEDVSSVKEAERFKTWQEAVKRIAHEIKNPLTPMKLNVQRIERYVENGQVDKTKISRLVQAIIREIDRISSLLTQFKHFSPVRTPKFEEFEVSDILNEVRTLYEGSNIKLEVKGNAKVKGDKKMLMDLFYNLINNSIEWGATQVRIEVSNEGITYSDNGRGISSEEALRIFEPYYSKNPKGMGLGMAIVKKIVEDHGWKIRAVPGNGGAHFEIRFT